MNFVIIHDAQQLIREVLRFAVLGDEEDSPTYDIHDYALNTQHTVRISTVNESLSEYFPHIPNSGLEDIAGEAFFTSYGGFGVGAHGPEPDPESETPPLTTAPYSLNINCAVGAHLNCPPTGPFRISGPHVPGGGGTGGGGCQELEDAAPLGSCMGPQNICCGRIVPDLGCHLTEARCVAPGCSILNGECLPPGETCCGTEVWDPTCPEPVTTRCVGNTH